MSCINWILKAKIAHDISSGMTYLHTLSPPVIHTELKLKNVFIGEELNAKVSGINE